MNIFCFKTCRPFFVAILLSASMAGGCGRGSGKDADDDKPDAKRAQPANASATQPVDKDKDEGDKVKLTAAAIEKYQLRMGKVNVHHLVPTFTAPARVEFDGDAMARVGSVVPGRIVDIKIKRGDMVQKGDELLVVESTDLGEAQSDYLQKTTALAAAVTAVEPTKVSYERAKRLYEQSEGLSLAELQKREADYRAAQALQAAAQGALSAAGRKLSLLGMSDDAVQAMVKSGQVTPRYSVRAPMSGRVIDRDVTLGQFVTPDKDSLIQLADMSRLWVVADVPEFRLPAVVAGATVRVTLPTGGPAIPGLVSFIASTVDLATRAGEVRVEVKGAESRLKAGMFAQVEIEATGEKEKARDVIAVPEEAVQIINGQTCIFVEDDDEENAFIKRPVAIGQEVNGLIPILSGLKEKEEIVKSGGFFLKAEFAKSSVKDTD